GADYPLHAGELGSCAGVHAPGCGAADPPAGPAWEWTGVIALKRIQFWMLLTTILVVSLVPLATESASLREDIFLLLMFVVLASSLNLITGYAGYVSFGDIVFFGAGSYVAIWLLVQTGLHVLPSILLSGAVTGALAYALGSAVLRLRGAYFAIATIAVNEAMR